MTAAERQHASQLFTDRLRKRWIALNTAVWAGLFFGGRTGALPDSDHVALAMEQHSNHMLPAYVLAFAGRAVLDGRLERPALLSASVVSSFGVFYELGVFDHRFGMGDTTHDVYDALYTSVAAFAGAWSLRAGTIE